MPSRPCFLIPVAVATLLSLVASRVQAADLEPNAETPSQRYVVPEGDVGALVEFVKRLSEYRPTTAEGDIEHRSNFRPALKRAAEKIINLENDRTSPAYAAAEFILLTDRVHSLARAVREEQTKTLADVKAYVVQRIEKGQGKVAADLAKLAAQTCRATGQYELAAEAYRDLGEVLAKCDEPGAANEGAGMLADAERLLALSKTVPNVPAAPEMPAGSKLVPLDLQMLGNYSVAGTAGSGEFAANGLAELQKGEQTFGGVRFQVGDKLIRMEDVKDRDGVLKVEGIPVNRRIARLFILHATGHGSPYFEDGTKIGSYAIRYEDGSQESIPIVYGEDVRDWWDFDEGKPVTRGRVVWTGRNLAADGYQVTIRLYLCVWRNPHPEKKVDAIDYLSSTATKCRPFCVAMTAEEPGGE